MYGPCSKFSRSSVSAGTLILNFPASRIMKYKSVVYELKRRSNDADFYRRFWEWVHLEVECDGSCYVLNALKGEDRAVWRPALNVLLLLFLFILGFSVLQRVVRRWDCTSLSLRAAFSHRTLFKYAPRYLFYVKGCFLIELSGVFFRMYFHFTVAILNAVGRN